MKLGFALICVDACTFLVHLLHSLISPSSATGARTHAHTTSSASRILAAVIRWTHLSRFDPFLSLLTFLLTWSYEQGSRQADDTSEQIASWNQTALEGYVRILVGCLFGACR